MPSLHSSKDVRLHSFFSFTARFSHTKNDEATQADHPHTLERRDQRPRRHQHLHPATPSTYKNASTTPCKQHIALNTKLLTFRCRKGKVQRITCTRPTLLCWKGVGGLEGQGSRHVCHLSVHRQDLRSQHRYQESLAKRCQRPERRSSAVAGRKGEKGRNDLHRTSSAGLEVHVSAVFVLWLQTLKSLSFAVEGVP